MKTFLFFIAVGVCIAANGQRKKTIEISATLNSVDPTLALGNIHFADTKTIEGSDFSNMSIAYGLTGKYFIAENIALRVRTIFTNKNIRESRNLYAGPNSYYDLQYHQQLLKIVPGIQWSMIQKKIAFFAGLELPMTFIGNMHEYVYNQSEISIGLQSPVLNSSTYTKEIMGGSIYGLGLFTGTNYYVSKKIAIGFEMATAFEKTKAGGDIRAHQVVTGLTPGDYNDTSQETIRQLKFADLQFSFNLTYQLR